MKKIADVLSLIKGKLIGQNTKVLIIVLCVILCQKMFGMVGIGVLLLLTISSDVITKENIEKLQSYIVSKILKI